LSSRISFWISSECAFVNVTGFNSLAKGRSFPAGLSSVLSVQVEYSVTLVRRASAINAWFPRAKGRPLFLYLHVDSVGEPDTDDIAIGMIDCAEFVGSIYPWLQFVSYLALGSMWITDLINLLVNAHLPNLERLTLVKLEEEWDSLDYDTL